MKQLTPALSICLLTISGVLTDEGVHCRTLRGEDGELYTLQALPAALATGDYVTVTTSGDRPALFGVCDQGRHIDWVEITRPATDRTPQESWKRTD